MSANCQQTFALSGFVDKHLIICPEVKSNFGLAASDFQSMVTGESVSANRKHQEIVTIRKWPSQLLMVIFFQINICINIDFDFY
jgi:phage/plasmid-associated DNA primase